MNLSGYYKIINITHHDGTSRKNCGRSSVMYRKYLDMSGQIIELKRGQPFVMDEIVFSSGNSFRGFILETSNVLSYIFNDDKSELLVATQNSIYFLKEHRD